MLLLFFLLKCVKFKYSILHLTGKEICWLSLEAFHFMDREIHFQSNICGCLWYYLNIPGTFIFMNIGVFIQKNWMTRKAEDPFYSWSLTLSYSVTETKSSQLSVQSPLCMGRRQWYKSPFVIFPRLHNEDYK